MNVMMQVFPNLHLSAYGILVENYLYEYVNTGMSILCFTLNLHALKPANRGFIYVNFKGTTSSTYIDLSPNNRFSFEN